MRFMRGFVGLGCMRLIGIFFEGFWNFFFGIPKFFFFFEIPKNLSPPTSNPAASNSTYPSASSTTSTTGPSAIPPV